MKVSPWAPAACRIFRRGSLGRTWLACPRVILQAFSAAGCWAELEDVIVAVMSCLWNKPALNFPAPSPPCASAPGKSCEHSARAWLSSLPAAGGVKSRQKRREQRVSPPPCIPGKRFCSSRLHLSYCLQVLIASYSLYEEGRQVTTLPPDFTSNCTF